MDTMKSEIKQNQGAVLSHQEIISAINHELRTPLAVSKEGVELLLDKITGDINEEQEKILFIAKRNLAKLAQTIEKVTDFIHNDSAFL